MPRNWDEVQWPPPWRRSPRWSRNRGARDHFRDPRVESDTVAPKPSPETQPQGFMRDGRSHTPESAKRAGHLSQNPALPRLGGLAAHAAGRGSENAVEAPPLANLCPQNYGAPGGGPAERPGFRSVEVTWQEVVEKKRKWHVLTRVARQAAATGVGRERRAVSQGLAAKWRWRCWAGTRTTMSAKLNWTYREVRQVSWEFANLGFYWIRLGGDWCSNVLLSPLFFRQSTLFR